MQKEKHMFDEHVCWPQRQWGTEWMLIFRTCIELSPPHWPLFFADTSGDISILETGSLYNFFLGLLMRRSKCLPESFSLNCFQFGILCMAQKFGNVKFWLSVSQIPSSVSYPSFPLYKTKPIMDISRESLVCCQLKSECVDQESFQEKKKKL